MKTCWFVFLGLIAIPAGRADGTGLPEVTELGFRQHADFTSRQMLDFLRAQHTAHTLQAKVLLLTSGARDLASGGSAEEYATSLGAIIAEAHGVCREIVWLNLAPGANGPWTDKFNQAAAAIMYREKIVTIDYNDFCRSLAPSFYTESGELTLAGLRKRDAFVQEALEEWWTTSAHSNPKLKFDPLWPDGPSPQFEDRGPERLNRVARIDHISVPEIVRYPAPAHPSGVALVVFPGGGYSYIGFIGTVPELAERLASEGICVIGLKYRTGRGADVALLDAARAVRYVRAHAREWGLDPHRVGITGQSAGAHLTWNLSTHFSAGDPASADPVERESSRPDFAAPLTSWGIGLKTKFVFSENSPPFFVRQARDDPGIGMAEELVAQLAAAHVPYDAHYLDQGGHGAFRLTPLDTTGNNWPAEFVPWLRHIGILP